MDKSRSNQILEILLWPYTDLMFDEQQIVLHYMQSYYELIDEKMIRTENISKRNKLAKDYADRKKELLQGLESKMQQPPKSLDDIFMLFELFFPSDIVLNARGGSLSSGLNKYYLYNLARIANSLLTFRDGCAAIRTWKNAKSNVYGEDIFGLEMAFDKVQVWNNLSRIMEPDVLTAVFFVMCGYDEDALYYQSSMVSLADKLLVKVLKKGIAETHIHMNAGFCFRSVWEKHMDLGLWLRALEGRNHLAEAAEENRLLDAACVRYLMIVYMNVPGPADAGLWNYIMDEAPVSVRAAADRVIHGKCGLRNRREQQELYSDIKIWIHSNAAEEFFSGNKDFLYESVYKNHEELHIGSEQLFLYQCFCHMKETGENFFERLFLQYIRIKNRFYRYGVQRNEVQGLDRFQDYFSGSKKLAASKLEQPGSLIGEGLQNLLNIRYLKKLEIRVTPAFSKQDGSALYELDYDKVKGHLKNTLLIEIKKILSIYRNLMLERMSTVKTAEAIRRQENRQAKYFSAEQLRSRYGIHYSEYQFPTIGIVFHFLKRESVDDTAGSFCWNGINEDIVKYSSHRFVQRKKLVCLAKAIEELRVEILHLSDYVVGIDAASNENASEPWIMAPAFNAIRNRKIVKPVKKFHRNGAYYQYISNMGFTYHVGEDFRHPLSGLRHVDEVIEYFGYKPGDRIGHAIVLGMDIERWIRENEVIPIKNREQMENYLWLWGKMMYSSWIVPVQIEVLEGMILEAARSIYDIKETGNAGCITVQMLYKAYCLKFKLNHEQILKKYLNKAEESAGSCMMRRTGTFCRYSRDTCELYEHSLWNEEKLLCTQYCPVFERRYEKVILAAVHEQEAEILQCIQHKIIQKIEERGIYIETNPTSNLAIGEIRQMGEHPIFKLNSLSRDKEEHHAMVTINSDDPSVFHTNTENEMAYIYHALVHDGYKKEEILEWIEKIRKYGLESSFVQKTKSAAVMLQQIADIMQQIDHRLQTG